MEKQELPHWEVGQLVEWSRVKPYYIADIPGFQQGRRNIHITTETGRFHVYWHRERDGQRVLIHHGGPDGFADLEAAKRQHERVILRYIGLSVEIPSQDQGVGTTPEPGQSFAELPERLAITIPGEQQTVGQWIAALQSIHLRFRTWREQQPPPVVGSGQLTGLRGELQQLLDSGLSRSINRFKRSAATTISAALTGSRGELLLAVNQAQLQLLMRAQEAVAITLGTMQRYNDLERLQRYYHDLIYSIWDTTTRATQVLQSGPESLWERQLDNLVQANSKLGELKGQPYKGWADDLARLFSPIDRLRERQNYQEVTRLLIKPGGPLAELEIRKSRIRELHIGIDFGKYQLEATPNLSG